MEKYARFKYMPCLPLGEDGRRITASKKHTALSRKAATEGMVLLKNDNKTLPLSKDSKVALFGKATIEYIKGGGGSGDVYVPYIRNIFEGVEEKITSQNIYMPLVDFYKDYVKRESVNIPSQEEINATWDIVNNMDFCTTRDDMTYDTFASMHVKEPAIESSMIKSASEFADTAIVTLSRFSAEGVDRRPIPSDYYLSDIEKNLLNEVTKCFKKVIVVINSGGVLDCEFLAENAGVNAILMSWQGGLEGGSAIADIIFGDVNPSGKLVDTIAKSYDAYPETEQFWESFDYVYYNEDIYVGYRYFETIPGAKEKVRYPFGFGLSYTTFEHTGKVCLEKDGKIFAIVDVKNTGDVAGKDILQLYYSAPQGKLGKPARELGAFKKTKLLNPGESETLVMSFDVNLMASFDDLGKIQKSAYVLEKGDYSFYLGTDVRSAEKLDFTYTVKEDRVVEQLKNWCKPFKLEKRMLADGSYENLPMGEPEYFYGKNEPITAKAPEELKKFDLVGTEITMDEFIAQMTIDELMYIVGGQKQVGMCNTGSFGGVERLGIPYVPTADGPAGLRLMESIGIPATAWPCATLLACSWDTDLIYEVGAAGGAEIRENNLGVWLAPALNIHRDPLCGRNFEYYSEDPIVSGKCGAAAIRGVQSQKTAVSMKHFACNNKEANRYQNDSRISERALREIYLKGFEIAVKEGKPWTVMSSYNLINGQHTSESYELLTGILRDEWGFDGMVVTDWGVKNDPVKEVKAGNDLKMHCGYPEDLKKALDSGDLTRADLEVCTRRILEMFMKLA